MKGFVARSGQSPNFRRKARKSYEELADADLWALIGQSDAAAYGELFSRYSGRIFNYCFRRLADRDVAEDLMAIVFMKVWEERSQVLEHESALPLLYGIANNICRNALRSRVRYRGALKRVRPSHDDGSADPTASVVHAKQEARMVLDGLARLPREQQEVVMLCGWEGLNYEDAALALNIPVGTVRSRLSRARQHLRSTETLEPFRPSGHIPGAKRITSDLPEDK